MAMAEFSSCAVLAMVTKLARNLKTQNVADERRHQVVKKRQAIVALSTEDDEEIEVCDLAYGHGFVLTVHLGPYRHHPHQ